MLIYCTILIFCMVLPKKKRYSVKSFGTFTVIYTKLHYCSRNAVRTSFVFYAYFFHTQQCLIVRI